MRLHAILTWYDESPTWLAGCIASLTRIGVDHLIAVDGRYPHFSPGAPTNSRPEQVDAITSAAMGADITLTLHRIDRPILEQEKRSLAFRLLNASAQYGDWVLVIDADEMVSSGTPGIRRELEMVDSATHVVACRITSAIDPYANPEADNDVSERTREIFHKLPVATQFGCLQSRLWRVLDDMRVEANHYTYTGVDQAGTRWNLRPDIGKPLKDYPLSPIETLPNSLTIEHRKNHRTRERRELKHAYYTTRDELGIERVS